MITETVAIAILTALGVEFSALVAGGITLAVQLAKWHTRNRQLWLWNRQLVDHIYEGKGPPPPEPPASLFQ